jgi:integrase
VIKKGFYLDHFKKGQKASGQDTIKLIFNQLVKPLLTDINLATVRSNELKEELKLLQHNQGSEPARKALVYARVFFKWCVDNEQSDPLTGEQILDNPLAGVKPPDIGVIKSKARSRVLATEEVPMLFTALDRSQLDNRSKIGLRLLLLNGNRVGELMAAKWSEVNLSKASWRIPAENTKTSEELIVMLAPQSVALFERLQAITGDNDSVMGGMSGGAQGKALARLQQTRKTAPIPNTKSENRQPLLPFDDKLTVHDLRRSFVTFLAELGVTSEIREKMVNHKLQGVAAVYTRSENYDERRKAAIKLADALDDPLNILPTAVF